MDRPGCPHARGLCDPRPAYVYQDCSADRYCPFFDLATENCQIRDTGAPLNGARQKFCRSDDYDGCPTYLGYLLRRTRPLRADSDWLDAI